MCPILYFIYEESPSVTQLEKGQSWDSNPADWLQHLHSEHQATHSGRHTDAHAQVHIHMCTHTCTQTPLALSCGFTCFRVCHMHSSLLTIWNMAPILRRCLLTLTKAMMPL